MSMESPPVDTGGAPGHEHGEDDPVTAAQDRPARPDAAASLDQVLRHADKVRKAEAHNDETRTDPTRSDEVDRPD
jgi:hypothetical protein